MTEDRSHTVWERLEPLTRNEELTGTLRGELADPLWLLSRQRQFGEFAGEDAGSPVSVSVDTAHDEVTRVGVGDETLDYDPATDPPVETLVEREPVAAGGDGSTAPSHATRAEAGMNFLDRLRRAAPGDGWQPSHFAPAYRLGEPTVNDEASSRYADVLDGESTTGERTARCLDGHAVYAELVGDASRPATAVDWSRFGDPVTTLLADGASTGTAPTLDRATFEPVAEAFVAWYADLYAEPGGSEDAWDPDRMEYEATVSAGAGSDETVFSASEYRGGRMDWYDFTATDDAVRTGGAATTTTSRSSLPTKASFRGMPASRLWELEDSNVDLASMSAAADDLSRLFLLEFALLTGDDWYTLPIEAPVGSVTRVTDLDVVDTFGVETTNVPPTAANATDWNYFTFDLPAHPGEPGLFLPPVVGTTLSGEDVEDVLFARDEVANLVFGVEGVVEGPLGDPLDRAEFRLPTVEIAAFHPAPSDLSGRTAADSESVALHNPGDATVELDGWRLYAQHSNLDAPASASNSDTVSLTGVEIPPEETVRVVTGGDAALDTAERVHLQRSAPVLAADRVVSVTKPMVDGSDGLVTVEPVERDALDEYPTYRLANDVADHWFPYLPTTDGRTHRFELGLLLDADALSGTVDAVPRPLGTVLDPDASVYDEAIPRGGVRVTRSYESAAWLDGHTHVWSSRTVRPGVGEVSSGLRFDFLDDGSDEE